jgi:hypothetical protein
MPVPNHLLPPRPHKTRRTIRLLLLRLLLQRPLQLLLLLPSASGITKLTSDQIVSPVLFYNGQGITYFDNQGNLYQSTLTNNSGALALTATKQLAIPAQANISKILWPAQGNNFIAQLSAPNSGAISWSYYNSTSGAYTLLPPQVESVSWLPNGNQIMYIWVSGGKATLKIGNPDTTGYQTLSNLYETDGTINVSPDGSQMLYYETQNASTTNPIYSISADGKTWKTLVADGQNLGVLWSPDGQKFLFGKKDPQSQNYQLWVDNISTGEIKNLSLFTTPDKAVWGIDSTTVYAAVPQSETPGSSSLTSDTFYQININTSVQSQYSSNPTTPVDGQNLFLDSTGSNLFFRNAQDGGLYYLNLTQTGSGS